MSPGARTRFPLSMASPALLGRYFWIASRDDEKRG